MNGILCRRSAGYKRERRGPIILIFLLAAAAQAVPASSQHRGIPAKRPVYVTASFLDRNGLFIEDLQKGEVEILENNQRREIEFMARDELPTVYGILFDRAMFSEREESVRPGQQSVPTGVAARDLAYQFIDKLLGRQVLWVGLYDQQPSGNGTG